MNVNGVGQSSAVQKILSQPVSREVSTAEGGVSRPSDKLELSGVNHLFKMLQKNDVRVDKVAQIKSQIEAGTYDEGAKMDVAVDRLLEDLSR
jgi:anti-sigma28 factor (negative regulator of flagellin synthesis)